MRSPRVGATTFFRLMQENAGDAEAALAALPGIAAAAGVADYTACPPELVDRELAAGRRCGAVPLFFSETAFPAALRDLSDAPPVLWAKGDLTLLARPAVAIVGARNASSLGRRMTKSLAAGLGKAGFVIASGLARGIDTMAHEAALDTGTIAVIAGGIDTIYPRENAALSDRIAERGAILSEMPPGLEPRARHFPRRNRIISGLSRGVVVVEAAARSGSLITARDALDQGREVLAVPGHPFDPRASGCNLLLRDGATLVRGPEDVIDALGPAPEHPSAAGSPRRKAPCQAARDPETPSGTSAAPPAGDAAPVRDRILALLGTAPIAEDQLLRDLSLPGPQIASELLDLELDGAIVRQPGGLLARA